MEIMKAKILGLALKALEHRKAEIEQEIFEIQAEMKGSRDIGKQLSQSERMKAYWAAKRADSAKIAKAPKASGKRRQMTAVEKEALSRKLKAAWVRRKNKS